MNQLASIDNNIDQLPMTAGQIQAQVNTLQQVMQQVMKENTHFGKIPGCDNPTLLKPGAEKILATFRLSADPEVEDLSTPDCVHYRVKVVLKTANGLFVGAGLGECSSNEEKYKWRTTYIEEEFEATDIDRRRIKYTKWKNQPTKQVKQIRTNPADLANTILKMAKKRALVDATLTATAASDIFTQDIEDLPDELQTNVVEQHSVSKNHSTAVPADAKPIVDKLEKIAQEGWDALQKAWGALTQDERDKVNGEFGRIKKIAESKK